MRILLKLIALAGFIAFVVQANGFKDILKLPLEHYFLISLGLIILYLIYRTFKRGPFLNYFKKTKEIELIERSVTNYTWGRAGEKITRTEAKILFKNYLEEHDLDKLGHLAIEGIRYEVEKFSEKMKAHEGEIKERIIEFQSGEYGEMDKNYVEENIKELKEELKNAQADWRCFLTHYINENGTFK